MTLAQPKKYYTPAEYYAIERDAAYKSDYYEGEIFDMSGGTSTHSLITANVTGELRQLLKGKPCVVYESNMRLKVGATGLRTYPDVNVYCEPLQLDPEDPENTTAMNPTVIVEVLSPSTEAYDRGFKSSHYRRVPSLKAHVLVEQKSPRVELYERTTDGWSFREVTGISESIRIGCIGVSLPLSEAYYRVEFAAVISPPLPPH